MQDPPPEQNPEAFGIGRLFWVMREAAIVADAASGRIMLWNPVAEELFQYPAAEALQLTVDVLVPESLKVQHRAGLAGYMRTGHGPYIDQRTVLELPALRKSGERCTVELSLNPLPDAPMPGRFVLAIIRDITDRKRAEEEHAQRLRDQMARAEAEAALRAQEDLIALLTHDLRTPLTALNGRLQLSLRHLTRPAEVDLDAIARDLRHMQTSVRRMSVMLDELLDLARLQRGLQLQLSRKPADLVAIVQSVAGDVQQTTRRHTLVVDAEMPELFGAWDEARLARVVENLLTNAVKYSPNGGHVRVTVTLDQDDSGRWAQLVVADDGIGIPAADLPHVFQQFFRAGNAEANASGSGIGLTGVKQIVEQHGGTIAIESREGGGTSVTVCLPLEA